MSLRERVMTLSTDLTHFASSEQSRIAEEGEGSHEITTTSFAEKFGHYFATLRKEMADAGVVDQLVSGFTAEKATPDSLVVLADHLAMLADSIQE